jgi:hypothetical protein
VNRTQLFTEKVYLQLSEEDLIISGLVKGIVERVSGPV